MAPVIASHKGQACGICTLDFSEKDQQFTHLGGENHNGFHESCLKEWLHYSETCPIDHTPINRNSLFSRTDRLRRVLSNAFYAGCVGALIGGLGVNLAEKVIRKIEPPAKLTQAEAGAHLLALMRKKTALKIAAKDAKTIAELVRLIIAQSSGVESLRKEREVSGLTALLIALSTAEQVIAVGGAIKAVEAEDLARRVAEVPAEIAALEAVVELLRPGAEIEPIHIDVVEEELGRRLSGLAAEMRALYAGGGLEAELAQTAAREESQRVVLAIQAARVEVARGVIEVAAAALAAAVTVTSAVATAGVAVETAVAPQALAGGELVRAALAGGAFGAGLGLTGGSLGSVLGIIIGTNVVLALVKVAGLLEEEGLLREGGRRGLKIILAGLAVTQLVLIEASNAALDQASFEMKALDILIKKGLVLRSNQILELGTLTRLSLEESRNSLALIGLKAAGVAALAGLVFRLLIKKGVNRGVLIPPHRIDYQNIRYGTGIGLLAGAVAMSSSPMPLLTAASTVTLVGGIATGILSLIRR